MNQEESDDQTKSQGSSTSDNDQTGDPGRTPGTAEGDEQTIDEDLQEKDNRGQK